MIKKCQCIIITLLVMGFARVCLIDEVGFVSEIMYIYNMRRVFDESLGASW